MKTINLTRGHVALVDDEDFELLNEHKWQAQPSRDDTHYATRSSTPDTPNGKRHQIRMHRVILGITDPNILVDHIDQNGLNNQRNNLRIANINQSNFNKKGHKGAKSKFKGVSWYPRNKKWGVRLRLNGNQKFYGLFKTEREAAKRYDEIAKEMFGEFAHLNFNDLLK